MWMVTLFACEGVLRKLNIICNGAKLAGLQTDWPACCHLGQTNESKISILCETKIKKNNKNICELILNGLNAGQASSAITTHVIAQKIASKCNKSLLMTKQENLCLCPRQ